LGAISVLRAAPKRKGALCDWLAALRARKPPKVMAVALANKGAHRYDEALGVTDAGLGINPNFVGLFSPRIVAENSLGRFEQANADARRAMQLSPRDHMIGTWHVELGDAEMSLGHFDAAIDEYRKAVDSGTRTFFAYTNLAAAYAHVGKMEEAKAALVEARQLNPKLTVKWMIEHTPNLPAVFDGVRKAGLPEE
jgi:tetratricopeptide (TPR) repeat protein